MSDTDGAELILWMSLFGAVVLWAHWDSAFVLSIRFGVDEKNISIENKPYDCEFLSAPIGLKHCSYEAVYALRLPQRYGDQERFLYVSYVKRRD